MAGEIPKGSGIVRLELDVVCDAADVYVDDVVRVRALFPVKAVMPDNWTYSCYNVEMCS